MTQHLEKKITYIVKDNTPLMGIGESILVVDDELSELQISKEILETRSYRVMTAVNGAEATALFASAKKNPLISL